MNNKSFPSLSRNPWTSLRGPQVSSFSLLDLVFVTALIVELLVAMQRVVAVMLGPQTVKKWVWLPPEETSQLLVRTKVCSEWTTVSIIGYKIKHQISTAGILHLGGHWEIDLCDVIKHPVTCFLGVLIALTDRRPFSGQEPSHIGLWLLFVGYLHPLSIPREWHQFSVSIHLIFPATQLV